MLDIKKKQLSEPMQNTVKISTDLTKQKKDLSRKS